MIKPKVAIAVTVALVVGMVAGAFIVSRLYPQLIGGVDANAGDFPAVVAIRNAGMPTVHRCAGVAVSASWVLTAAHCVPKWGDTSALINQSLTLGGGTALKSTKICVMPGFNQGVRPYVYDLAMIQVAGTLKSPADRAAASGSKIVVVGWGAVPAWQAPWTKTLQKVKTTWIDHVACKTHPIFGGGVAAEHLCVGDTSTGACHGDSGGPVMDASTKDVIGIISDVEAPANQCPSDSDLATAIRVAEHDAWIEKVLTSNSCS